MVSKPSIEPLVQFLLLLQIKECGHNEALAAGGYIAVAEFLAEP